MLKILNLLFEFKLVKVMFDEEEIYIFFFMLKVNCNVKCNLYCDYSDSCLINCFLVFCFKLGKFDYV